MVPLLYVRLKKVHGGMMGFGDTPISKTYLFLRVSRKGAEGGGGGGGGGGSLNLVFYGSVFKTENWHNIFKTAQ